MSKIKSSLELALERSSDLKVDKDAVRRDQAVRRGKQAVGTYLGDPASIDLGGELSSADEGERDGVKQGMVESLLANITLPRYEADLAGLPVISRGLQALALGDRKGKKTADAIEQLFGQYADIFRQYLETMERIEEQMRAQWEPQLRRKEQILKQQTGRNVHLTPEEDPEFAKALSDEFGQLNSQYLDAIAQGRASIRQLL